MESLLSDRECHIYNLPFISLEMLFTIQKILLSIAKSKSCLPTGLILFQAYLCCKVECVCWESEAAEKTQGGAYQSLKKIFKYHSCMRKQDSRSDSNMLYMKL